MSKASLCIQMLRLLNTGKIFKASELADRLETNTRNIFEYKTELEDAGYLIESIPGRYGGYRLVKSGLFPVINLTEDEKEALTDGLTYLEKRNDFMRKDKYIDAMAKVMSSISGSQEVDDLVLINRFPLSMPEQEIKNRYDFFKKQIDCKTEAKFTYISLKNEVKEHIIHPYELFMYNNAWYVIGWSEKSDRAVYYKLNRIQGYESTGIKFRKKYAYRRSDYLDEAGFKNNGEWYHVEFEAYNQYAMLVQERIYGKNQTVTIVNDNTTRVAVDMQNKENILVFILGFGVNVNVLEPQWLRESIKEVANGLIGQYE